MKLSGLLLTLAISPFAFSGEIITNNDIQVLSLNGTDVDSSSIVDGVLQAKDGTQQIVVRYSKTFRNEPIIQSRPFIFNVEVAGKTTITTDELNSYSLAKNQVRDGLDWHISNQEKTYTIENAEELMGKGFLPYSNIGALVAQYNIDNNLVVSNAPDTQSITKMTTNSLIEAYRSATTEQKEAFNTWLTNSEGK